MCYIRSLSPMCSSSLSTPVCTRRVFTGILSVQAPARSIIFVIQVNEAAVKSCARPALSSPYLDLCVRTSYTALHAEDVEESSLARSLARSGWQVLKQLANDRLPPSLRLFLWRRRRVRLPPPRPLPCLPPPPLPLLFSPLPSPSSSSSPAAASRPVDRRSTCFASSVRPSMQLWS